MKIRFLVLIAIGGLLALFVDACFILALRRPPAVAIPMMTATRLATAKDLVRRHALDGKSRAEVIGLLGDERLGGTPADVLRYDLREDFGNGIDPAGGVVLVIRLDARDRVIDAHEEAWHRR